MDTLCLPSGAGARASDALAAARDVIAPYARALDRWNPANTPSGPSLDLARVPSAISEIVNRLLGEGEVAIGVSGVRVARVQETGFTGLWRVCEFDDAGNLDAHRLEASAVPSLVLDAARANAARTTSVDAMSEEATGARALLRDIAARLRTRSLAQAAHVFNLTLLPLAPDDYRLLELALPAGAVDIVARGFGTCRLASTGVRDVWRVRYFNNLNALILDTVEVVDVPQLALASVEDLNETRARLGELVEWMSESCPA